MVRKSVWGTMFVLALGVAGYALSNAFYPEMRTGLVADLFTAKPWRALGHLAAGGMALLAGALQFSTEIRWRWPSLHRGLGYAYAVTVLVSGASAVAMASSSSGGIPGHFGFGILGVLWVGTTAVAFLMVRNQDFEGHRAWMIRSYALCLAAVTLRIYLPASLAMGLPFDEAYPAIAWLCWVPNLIVAEWILIGSSIAPLAPPVHRAAGGSP